MQMQRSAGKCNECKRHVHRRRSGDGDGSYLSGSAPSEQTHRFKLRTMPTNTNIWLAVIALTTTCATYPTYACSTIRVSGFSSNDCILDPCHPDGCEVSAADANGEWHLLQGVGEQLADSGGDMQCSAKLPVYFKTFETGSGNNTGVRTLFLYYDATGGTTNYLFPQPIGAPERVSGWAIGTSIGSICSDDRSACGYGNVPSTCCTMGLEGTLSPNSDANFCRSWLMRQSESEWNIPRNAPWNSIGTWEIRAKGCSCYAGTFCRSRTDERWVNAQENRMIQIHCAAAADSTPDPVYPVFETTECPLDRETSYYQHNDATCRTSRCQGCCDFYSPDGSCETTTTSCACNGPNPIWPDDDPEDNLEELASEAFEEFDRNGNGLLSRKEARRFAADAGATLGKALNRYIRSLDTDKNRQLNLEEFLPMYEHYYDSAE